MSALRHEPLVRRGPGRAARRSTLWLLSLVLATSGALAGTVLLPSAHLATGGPVATGSANPLSVMPAAGDPTHGDLVVAAGATVYLPDKSPPAGPISYYQGGNITVQRGGTLIVQNTSLIFVQFVGDSGVPAARLHVYRLVDDGTVIFRNSTLTTQTYALNPYDKLTVVDNGNLTFWHSTVETAGTISVGSGGNLVFNGSSVLPNPSALSLNVTGLIDGDSAYAPTISVGAGGEASLFSSTVRGLYANNLTANGTPNPLPAKFVGATVQNGTNASGFATNTTTLGLYQDDLYPDGIAGGSLNVSYVDRNGANTVARVYVWYEGRNYSLGSTTFVAGASRSVVLTLPSALDSAINTSGMLGWLNATGAFGTPAALSVAFWITTGPAVAGTNLTFTLQAPVNYGLSVSGAGSQLYLVDSFVALGFAPSGAEPWEVHNLSLSGGATAFLANLTVAGKLPNPTFLAEPAVYVQGSGNAYLYRWAQVQLYGSNGVEKVPGATLSAQYAYATPQLDNASAAYANALRTSAPPIWNYLQYLDSVSGTANYGESGPSGVASLLLATDNITSGSVPDGDFLGDYHVIVTPPAGAGSAESFAASLPAYPLGVANGSVGYGQAASLGTFTIPGYYALTTVPANGITTYANGTLTNAILIGQELRVAVNVTDDGPAPITSLAATLYYNSTNSVTLASVQEPPPPVDLTAVGQATTLNLTWQVNDSVVGDPGTPVYDNLSIVVSWNQGAPSAGGGIFSKVTEVIFKPGHVAIGRLVVVPPSQLTPLPALGSYLVEGYVLYNGSRDATVDLYARPTSGGSQILLAQTTVSPGRPEGSGTLYYLYFSTTPLSSGKAYTFTVQASYDGVTSTPLTLGANFEVPGPAPAKNFLSEKFAGLTGLEWIILAVVIAAAAIGFVLFTRRQAAGKLVECGECGNLVPEDSKVCPKCGAEFETDVVRCSRCSSTIPASSTFCPECAAQLLGKPGEGEVDPERQAYADFTERFRAEAKKELGDNYSEGAFWDWWKRQPSYTPFSQWKLQQSQGTPRTGMMPPPPGAPPPGGAGLPPSTTAKGAGTPPSSRPSPPSGAAPSPGKAPSAAPPPGATGTGGLRPCPNCGKEIPPEYLVCPFCGAVTQ